MPNFNDIVDFILTPEVSKIIVIVLLSYLVLLWVALIVWVTKDIISRTNNIIFQIVSILLATILNIFGVLIYLAIRPSKTLIEKFFEDLEYEALVQETKKVKKEKKSKKRSTQNKKKS
jgi:hypothetical protein